jgi:hydrogenase maturation protein HypF
LVDDKSFIRKSHLREFPLPGGESAVREPRRTAVGLLYAIFGDELFNMKGIKSLEAFEAKERIILKQVLNQGINCPITSSAGRLFDAIASLLDIRHINGFSGQAAMMLGFKAEEAATEAAYRFSLIETQRDYILDWEPMVQDILEGLENEDPPSIIAAKFHNTLAEMIVAIAERVGEKRVALTGGCFQNRYLTERAVKRLGLKGFEVFCHRRVPPNDGGIALGQMMALARKEKGGR